MANVHVKKGDKVVVLSGGDKGKQGTVTKVLPKKNKVVVDGVNIQKKHQKPRPPAEEGGIKEIAAPIHASNVKKVEKKAKAAAAPKAAKETKSTKSTKKASKKSQAKKK